MSSPETPGQAAATLSVREAVLRSSQLLTPRDRKRLLLAVAAQVATAFLDLIGLLLVGLVTALALNGDSSGGSTIPPVVRALGLSRFSETEVAVAAGSAAAVVMLAKTLTSSLIVRRTLRFLAARAAQAATGLAGALLAQPLPEVQRRASQQVAYALTTGANYAVVSVLGYAGIALSEAVLLVVLGAALLVLDPLVTVGAIAYFGLVAVLLQRVLGDWAGSAGLAQARADIASTVAVQDALASYRELTVLHRKSFYERRISELRTTAAGSVADAAFIGQLPRQVLDAALVLGACLLTGSQLLWREPSEAVATMVLFLAAASRILPSMLRLQGATTAIRNAAAAAAATYDLAGADGPPRIAERSDSNPGFQLSEHGDFAATIDVDDVWVTYPDASAPALSGISVSVPAGGTLALVGPTGAGKSTLADIILGVLDPDRGTVKLGGIPPRSAFARWPGAVAYVPQAVALSDATVRENVAIGLPDSAIDDDRVWEALERAHLAHLLRDERAGLRTWVGERGVRLSGGQRQRLGLARALYTRPRLLVLDEATSALDAETETAVTETLRELRGTVTTITIAHRLATVRAADMVLYLEQGEVMARGAFEEACAQSPALRRQAVLLGLLPA